MKPYKHYINAFSLFFIVPLYSMQAEYLPITGQLPATTASSSIRALFTIAKEYLSVANPFAVVSYHGLSREDKDLVFHDAAHLYAFTTMLGIAIMIGSSSFLQPNACPQGFSIGGILAVTGLINGIRAVFAQ